MSKKITELIETKSITKRLKYGTDEVELSKNGKPLFRVEGLIDEIINFANGSEIELKQKFSYKTELELKEGVKYMVTLQQVTMSEKGSSQVSHYYSIVEAKEVK